MAVHQADVCVIGAGLAGIVTALELIERGHRVALVDGATADRCGGQANEAFGGMLLSGTPEQRRNGVRDNPELLLADWQAAACFEDDDEWPRHWAEFYAENCRSMIYDWLKGYGIRFFPSVQWVERGNFGDGNSLPRYHIAWGCGRGVVQTLAKALFEHENQHLLTSLFEHRVTDLEQAGGAITGCSGHHGRSAFRVQAPHTVVCSGGINGNLDRVRANWASCYGPAPGNLLAGSHPDADGALHDVVSGHGGRVTHLEWMWNYAAGVRQPDPVFEGQGLSLIPPRSALWLDAYGQRVGPMPLVTGFDTHDLCCRVGNLPHQYSWQVLNRRMAIRELAASGTDTNPDFRDGRLLRVVWNALRGGDPSLTDWLLKSCSDVVSADTPWELAERMNQVTDEERINPTTLESTIGTYDALLRRDRKFHNDDQIRKLHQLRRWPADRLRTCRPQPLINPDAGPLIAIHERLISRKSMGGMMTDLNSRLMADNNTPVPGLYAAGEAAGFGGGGISGVRSLEGTFLSNCILNARQAAAAIHSNP